MTAKQSIFGRITQLARANFNSLLDSAEDPKKMLDQLTRDYINNIAEAESAVAETVGNLRLLEADYNEDLKAAGEWKKKALAASQKADQLHAQGKTADAEKFNELTKVALQRQMQAEKEVRAAEPTIKAQQEVTAKLKEGLNAMKTKSNELNAKRNELVSRSKIAETQGRVHEALKSINVLDPTSEVSRFEEKVRREEARSLGMTEIANSSLDAQFSMLEDLGENTEIEARFAALKEGNSPQIESKYGNSAKSIEAGEDTDLDYVDHKLSPEEDQEATTAKKTFDH